MKLPVSLVVSATLAASTLASPCPVLGAAAPVVSLAELDAKARARMAAQARVPLAPATSPVFTGIETFETAGSGRVPNYLRALEIGRVHV